MVDDGAVLTFATVKLGVLGSIPECFCDLRIFVSSSGVFLV